MLQESSRSSNSSARFHFPSTALALPTLLLLFVVHSLPYPPGEKTKYANSMITPPAIVLERALLYLPPNDD